MTTVARPKLIALLKMKYTITAAVRLGQGVNIEAQKMVDEALGKKLNWAEIPGSEIILDDYQQFDLMTQVELFSEEAQKLSELSDVKLHPVPLASA